MSLRVAPLTGPEFQAALPELAQLRIEVFRAFPYLYDGTLTYEQHYLRSYRDTPNAVLVAAFDGGRIVGAATGMPLADHGDASQITGPMPDADGVFYCAESVLLPAYRGRGIGQRFFDLREDHARNLGASHSAFCAVVRPANHPLKPADYRPLDGFWRSRGYAPQTGATAQFSWADLGEAAETPKTLQVWIKDLCA